MSDIEFVNFKKFASSPSRSRIPSGVARLLSKPSQGPGKYGMYSLYISAERASLPFRKGLEWLRIGRNNLTGEIYLVFSGERDGAVKTAMSEGKPARLLNRGFTECLVSLLGLRPGEDGAVRADLRLSENLANTDIFVTYRVSGAKTEG